MKRKRRRWLSLLLVVMILVSTIAPVYADTGLGSGQADATEVTVEATEEASEPTDAPAETEPAETQPEETEPQETQSQEDAEDPTDSTEVTEPEATDPEETQPVETQPEETEPPAEESEKQTGNSALNVEYYDAFSAESVPAVMSDDGAAPAADYTDGYSVRIASVYANGSGITLSYNGTDMYVDHISFHKVYKNGAFQWAFCIEPTTPMLDSSGGQELPCSHVL